MSEPIYRPERISNVRSTQFSIARHYGGCKVNGVYYHYDQDSDTLIREDVWKAQLAAKKKAIAAERKRHAAQQAFTEF